MKAIRDYIYEHRLTQAAFAKSVDLSETMVSLWLNGERHLGARAALRVKKVTGLSLDEIYRDAK